ncbi:hypothetical protein GLYMA_12G151050v4 [Glycine max]|nr:hypothetical protein GLYMA_12G151050v4 [Glycine max]KAH1143282.1 hypothetical protein GYH30_033813 [Glycine max]
MVWVYLFVFVLNQSLGTCKIQSICFSNEIFSISLR